MFREPINVELTEDHFAINGNIEYPSTSGNEFGFDSRSLFNRFRQTDGCGQIISLIAIGDRYTH